MKTIAWYTLVLFILLKLSPVLAGTPDSALVSRYFRELQDVVMKDHGQFWGLSLDGPIFCIDPPSREFLSNCQSAHNRLRPQGDLFFGILPAGTSSANSTLNFDGENWTMVMWPLPEDYNKRIDLMVHESFHRIQKYLGFKMGNPMVSCLDKKDGRIWFRLEVNALYKAVLSHDDEMLKALKHALYFRYRRFIEYPDPGKSEIMLETSEGLAQYTGYHMAYHQNAELQSGYFKDLMVLFANTPSLLRSSAYYTGPGYGELFDRLNPGWNRKLIDSADFFALGMKLCGISPQTLSAMNEKDFREEYGYTGILKEETLRQDANDKRVQEYREKFLGKNVFNIRFKEMNIGFNPGNLVNLDDTGTVYPNCNVSDYFGTLTVTKGALMFNDWKSMNITPPLSVSDTVVSGDGWNIRLKPGWVVRKNAEGIYELNR
ncbi:MAG: hypothetical protein WCO02_07675 [Bacteroidota bacterium]